MNDVLAAPVGLIGLGKMGSAMALRLAEQDVRVRAYDIDPVPQRRLAGTSGISVCPTAAEAAAGCRAVITMLPDWPQITGILLEGGGLARSAGPGTLVVEMSSAAPSRTREVGARLQEAGLRMIDAPVSGGITGARTGSLTIMVGGAESDVDDAMPLLRCLGTRITRVGALGCGHAVKAVNNTLYANSLVASAEALCTLKACGVPVQTAIDVLTASSGSNWALGNRIRRNVTARDFTAAMSAQWMLKDVRHGVELAAAADGRHEAALVALDAFERYCAAGHGEDVDFGVVRLVEDAFGVTID